MLVALSRIKSMIIIPWKFLSLAFTDYECVRISSFQYQLPIQFQPKKTNNQPFCTHKMSKIMRPHRPFPSISLFAEREKKLFGISQNFRKTKINLFSNSRDMCIGQDISSFSSFVLFFQTPLFCGRKICMHVYNNKKNSHSNKSEKKSVCICIVFFCGVFKLCMCIVCMFSFCLSFFCIFNFVWHLGTQKKEENKQKTNKQKNKRLPSRIFSFFSHCNGIYRTIRLEKPLWLLFVIQITL